MESHLKEPADRRHISLFMNGCQMPIMSRPHSGRSREQRGVTANGATSAKGNKDVKCGSDKSSLWTEGSSSHGVYEESGRNSTSASSDVHHYNILSKNESENDELSALFACSTALDGRIRNKTVCDKPSNSNSTKMRPHTAHTPTDKGKSSSWTVVKKEDNKVVPSSSSRVKSGNRKVLHRSISISSLPDRMNFGKAPNHHRNRVPMLNCYCLNDELNTDVLPKIIDAASYAKCKAAQRKTSVPYVASVAKHTESSVKVNGSSPPAVEEPVNVHSPSSKVTKMLSLMPLLGFKLGQNEAALRIQKWFKRHSGRRKAADAALRRMKSSPSDTDLDKPSVVNTKVLDSSSDTTVDQLLACAHTHSSACSSNKSVLQRKKSSIALHTIQLDDIAGCNTSSENTKIVSQQSDMEAPVMKERHLLNRRRKSEGDVSKFASDQQQRSLSDGALRAEHNNSLKSSDSTRCPQTPKKVACVTVKPSSRHDGVQRCNSAPRTFHSHVHQRAVSRIKVKIPVEKGDLSNDSLDIVQNNLYDSDDDKRDENKRDSHSPHSQKLVECPASFSISRRPSDDEAVIVRPVPFQPTSDSAASSSNDVLAMGNNAPEHSNRKTPSSKHNPQRRDGYTSTNDDYFCEEINTGSDVMVDELFSGSGKVYADENIIPLQLRNIEQLLLRSTSTEVSASPRTAVTSVNSDASAVDSLNGCRENPLRLIPVASCTGSTDKSLPNISTLDNTGNQDKGLTVEQVEKLNRQSVLEHSEGIGILTESKLRDIILFLDEVEHTDDLSDVRSRATLPKPEKTARAMEPEIKKLMTKHHTDVNELKDRHMQEMQETGEEMQKRLDAEVEKVKKAVAENVDRAVAKEREAAQKRLEECLAQEHASFEDKNQRLIEEITHLKNLLEIQEQQYHLKLEQARSSYEATRKKDIESLQAEYIRRHEDELLKHKSEIKKLKEKLQVEHGLEEETLQKQHEEALVAQEKMLREQYKKDRDQQIELVLRRLEDETTASRQESDRATEHRIRSWIVSSSLINIFVQNFT